MYDKEPRYNELRYGEHILPVPGLGPSLHRGSTVKLRAFLAIKSTVDKLNELK